MAKRVKNLVFKVSQKEMQVLDKFVFGNWSTKSKIMRRLFQHEIAFEIQQKLKVAYKSEVASHDFRVKFDIEFHKDSLFPYQIRMFKLSDYASVKVLKNIDVDDFMEVM